MYSWMEIGLRTLSAVIFLLLMTKLLGKRQVTELSVFEYITGISIGNIAAYISLDTDAQWYLGFLALGVWVAVSLGIEMLQLKSKRVRNWIDGTPTVLIQKGKILEKNLKRERLTTDELLQQLRTKDAFNVDQVEFAVMESSGAINVLLKSEYQPLTPKTLGMRVPAEHEPKPVIMDGKVLHDTLEQRGYNFNWLVKELKKSDLQVEDVFLAQMDDYGSLFIDLYDDKVKTPKTQNQAALLAQLKKCEADMEMYSLLTPDENERLKYVACSNQLKHLIDEVRPLIYQ
ncbi:uncharacterized membrane protein YcaP (DUF421 family) [Paenibacillus taihuensis]|uniref:Uncharacterized membrane protein YcaP (DUF421 family) n=1 Tax=Paenibacillus taihuensis TaxID=1156355 RepID=A0A3D9RWX5_9BACL|nr:DUF421 domain-containing protein [Paenibacillus taihuensis]REE84327.1 uncharacterized membrane protein YcaP (DUF421 family) [Paenibacillus taihuensis]